jgi:hypothetical protein
MRHANRTAHFWMLGAFIGVVLALSAPLHAQYTVGNPAVAKSTSVLTTDGSYWDASQFLVGSGTADICSKINAAWTAAMATVTSATIDARGLTGAQTCAASPFPTVSGVKASGTLLLGNAQISTSVTWQIPSLVHVVGLGISALNPSAAEYTANTIIRAASTSVSPVVQLGNGTALSFDAQVHNLTIDAAGAAVGILNNSSQEGSTVEDVNIYNASGTGLLIQATSSNCGGTSTCTPANSGPYRNLNIQYNSECGSSCGTSTTGLAVNVASGTGAQGRVVRGIDNVTVSGVPFGSSGHIGSCMQLIGFPVQITNSHVEYCTTGIQIGEKAGTGIPVTSNITIQNVSTDPFNGYDITITNAGDILLSGITGNGTEILQDNVTTNTINGTAGVTYYLGLYVLGDTTSGSSTPAVISTSAAVSSGPHGTNLEWVAPGGLDVLSALQKPTGSFKIDHPLDPSNKYLYHSFVESPDMMNVYNGSITTDKRGMATVTLPDYFDALNRDFRYQLTAIGSFAQATVAKEIQDNRFAIRTSKPGVKVSWQVTGIRQDAYANAHRIQVEEQKPPREQGHYLHPELFENGGKAVIAKEELRK